MIGKTISHYKILEKLGEGGMGVVYKAEDTKLKRTVALKFLPEHALSSKDDKARFVHEAQSAAALHHPNICTIHEVDEVDGKTFIAMSHLEGESLKARTDRGPLPLDEVVTIGMQVANGLRAAHEKNIVHRDIKGANIMIDDHGQATIMDFGLAKQADQTQITQEGMIVGTVAYMSPEQARGEGVDQRTDIWGLGVVLFEMITGRLPFRGDAQSAVFYSILNEDVEPVTALRTDVPMVLEHTVRKALAKNPNERYQNMTDLLVDLRLAEKELEKTGLRRPEPVEGISFMKDLLQRHVPQIVGVYLAIGFGVLQFVQWLVDRYPISPNLPDFSLALLASMVPTVLLLAYFHGRPGRDRWTRVERLGIPVNVLAAGALLLVLFQGKDIGAVTTTVQTTDKEGNTVERVVPKSEFRKKIALFYFDNETGDATYDWLQRGIIHLLRYEFYQDMYLWNNYGFTYQHQQAGFDTPIGAPLTLKKKLAADSNLDYFVAGSFTKENGDLVMRAGLYDTKKGNRISERAYSGRDVFKMIDSMSVELRRDMKIPSYHIKESPDLPISEVVTSSLEALELFSTGAAAAMERNDLEAARDDLKKAIKLDPTFAVAGWNLSGVYSMLNQDRYATRTLRNAMKHRYKLPETAQFELEHTYYLRENDPEAGFEHAKRWVALYPNSVDAHMALAGWFEWKNDLDQAILEREAVLALDPQRKDELQEISRLLEAKGDYERALDYGERYVALFPDKVESFTRLANLCTSVGDHERARANLKKALLVEPDKVATLTKLAKVEFRLGEYDQALDRCMKTLEVTSSWGDSLNVYSSIANLRRMQGQMASSLDYFDRGYAVWEKHAPPFMVKVQKSLYMSYYVDGGKEDVALEFLDALYAEATMLVVKEGIIGSAYLATYDALDDASYLPEAEARVARYDSITQQFDAQMVRWQVFHGKGMIDRWRGEDEQALQHYERALELIPKNEGPAIRDLERKCGSCCRRLGDFVRAQEHLEKALKTHPSAPKTHYEMALLYHDMGDQDKASEHLSKALLVWKDADPVYRPANKARETLAAWKAAGTGIQ